jgi:hypothetical protein
MNVLRPLLLAACAAGPVSTLAATIDWSKPVICAVLRTVECGVGEKCTSGSAESINVPQFLRIDLGRRRMTGLRPSGEQAATTAHTLEDMSNSLILQGIEEGRGWTAVIDKISGKLVASAAGSQAGFLVFGACTSLVADNPE